MKVELVFFAMARDLAGGEKREVDIPPDATVDDLRTALGEAIPALAPLAPRLLFARGVEYLDASARLAENDTIVCFPPVSGG